MPLPWEDWVPGLNNGHLTMREVFDTLPGITPDEVAWHVRMLENPASPISFTGAIELHPHDCVHILLGRGLLNQDEAFVIGYTMGTNKRIPRWQLWAFEKIATYFYWSSWPVYGHNALPSSLCPRRFNIAGESLANATCDAQQVPLAGATPS